MFFTVTSFRFLWISADFPFYGTLLIIWFFFGGKWKGPAPGRGTSRIGIGCTSKLLTKSCYILLC